MSAISFSAWPVGTDTEIDWKAYMQQVETVLQGETDYKEISGQTGPLVYPAGFVHVFTAMYWVTDGGNIARAQVLFWLIYLVNLAIVFEIYIRLRSTPPWALCLLTLSKRIHSIFVLRLFNDCVAMLLAHIALLMLINSRMGGSIVLFSAAVSVKMNVLLMAPSVLIVILMAGSMADLVYGLVGGLALQILLAFPFLANNPWSYMSRAFEFSRVFEYQWTVNWKILPESVFVGKPLAIFLLIAHVVFLVGLAHMNWSAGSGGLFNLWRIFFSGSLSKKFLMPDFVVWCVFTGNFLGIVFARSLHYQFYSWYFFSLPFLLWQTSHSLALKLGLFTCIEICWNVFPASAVSSSLLLMSHICLLIGLCFKRPTALEPKVRQA